MQHPALRHIRNTLIAALGLSGCIEQAPSTAEPDPRPALDALLDGPPLDGAQRSDVGVTDAMPPDAAERPDTRLADARSTDGEPPPDGAPPAPRAAPCDGVPIPGADGEPSGYVRCADGSVDRVGPARCTPDAPAGFCPAGFDGGECQVDSDCVARPFGRCGLPSGLVDVPGCICTYGCATDDDCAAGAVCACDTTGEVAAPGVCVPERCNDAADCPGGRCGLARFEEGCGVIPALGCRTADDACTHNRECVPCDDGDGLCLAECWPTDFGGSQTGEVDRWRCDAPGSVCGRPLRAGARPRLAAERRGPGWRRPVELSSRPADAERLAAHWAEIAALEHASVASFARFSMQLMALGAPAELLADCQQAAADEVEHARLAYGIASAFAGRALEPGPLSLAGITLDADPATVLREVIVEGCIGETLGAAEAAEAARVIREPAIAAACRRIAEDELQHAALGWRTARWLLAERPDLARTVPAALREGMRRHHFAVDGSDPVVAAAGIAVRPGLRQATMRQVIRPLLEGLLAGI